MVSSRQRARQGYPDRVNAPVVSGAEWVSQFEAGRELGVSLFRVGMLIGNRHLDPAENSDGVAGVTRVSLDRELEWRRRSGLIRRAGRTMGDLIWWI